VVFDEATSALDKDTELALFENLLKLEWQPSIIWISHRQYLLKKFNKILRLS